MYVFNMLCALFGMKRRNLLQECTELKAAKLYQYIC